MPTIKYDENNPNFNTEDIVENEETIRTHLTFPNVKVLVSDQGCGCGFRHTMFEKNGWLEVTDGYNIPLDNSNHEKLVDFILKNNKGETSVELFGLWNGDIYPPEFWETISLNDLLNPEFYFKERGLYKVEL